MRIENQTTGVRLRLVIAPGVALGPGKIEMLDGIRATGSIAASGRRMRMSYKRAWHLVESLNRLFEQPVVETAKGGRQGGGARLTPFGEAVLERYRRVLAAAEAAAAPELAALEPAVRALAESGRDGPPDAP